MDVSTTMQFKPAQMILTGPKGYASGTEQSITIWTSALVCSPSLYAVALSAGYPTALSESMERKSCEHDAI